MYHVSWRTIISCVPHMRDILLLFNFLFVAWLALNTIYGFQCSLVDIDYLITKTRKFIIFLWSWFSFLIWEKIRNENTFLDQWLPLHTFLGQWLPLHTILGQWLLLHTFFGLVAALAHLIGQWLPLNFYLAPFSFFRYAPSFWEECKMVGLTFHLTFHLVPCL